MAHAKIGQGPQRICVDSWEHGDFVQFAWMGEHFTPTVFMYVQRENVPALIATLQAALAEKAEVAS